MSMHAEDGSMHSKETVNNFWIADFIAIFVLNSVAKIMDFKILYDTY